MNWWQNPERIQWIYPEDLENLTDGVEKIPEDEPYIIHPGREHRLFTVADAAAELGIGSGAALYHLKSKGVFKDSIKSPITIPEYDLLADEFCVELPQVTKTTKKEERNMDVFTNAEAMALEVNHGITSVGELAVFYRGSSPEDGIKLAEVELETTDCVVSGSAYYNQTEKRLDWKFNTTEGWTPYSAPQVLIKELTKETAMKYAAAAKTEASAAEPEVTEVVEPEAVNSATELASEGTPPWDITEADASTADATPARNLEPTPEVDTTSEAIKLVSSQNPATHKAIINSLRNIKRRYKAGKPISNAVIGQLIANTANGPIFVKAAFDKDGKINFIARRNNWQLPLVEADDKQLTEMFRKLWLDIKVGAPAVTRTPQPSGTNNPASREPHASGEQAATRGTDGSNTSAKRKASASKPCMKDFGVRHWDAKVLKTGNIRSGDVVAKVFLHAINGKKATFVAIKPYKGEMLEFKELGGSHKVNPKFQPFLSQKVMELIRI